MSEQKTTAGRWQKRLLVGSLALNLIIVGAIAGLALSGGPKGGPSRLDLTAGPITRAMESEQRDNVRHALRDSNVFRPANRAQMREDMQALLMTLRAETFDEESFRAALNRQRERLQTGQETVLNAVTNEIADMSLEQRTAFADRLEQHLRFRGGPHGGRDN